MDAQILAEMNNMRIRIDERDGKIANQSVVITKLEQSRKDMKKDNARLLKALEANNTLLLNMSREALIREDWRSTHVADQIRDNYETIRKVKE